MLFYALTQGAQFLSLLYLPAVATSLLLSCTTILVGLLGVVLLEESPAAVQWGATVLYLGGVLLYFFPLRFAFRTTIGIVAALVGVLANALSSILGRHLNRSGVIDPLTVTTVSMGVGALVLLAAGIATQGLPRLSLNSWLVVLWLAVVNSAFAFTLWNRTLRTLSAMQSSIINNTMLFQIALLAWIFLDEKLTWRQVVGMAIAAVAVAVVQVRRRPLKQPG